jgi:dihydroxyacetone kinase
MLDALMPACDAFETALAGGATVPRALAAAADAAEAGAAETASLVPRRGRSSYLGKRAVGHPDPGARAVAVWTGALARAFAARPGHRAEAGSVVPPPVRVDPE